jgi:hypothetical protein
MNQTDRNRQARRFMLRRQYEESRGLVRPEYWLLSMLEKAGDAGVCAGSLPAFNLNAAIAAGHALRYSARPDKTILRARITPAGLRALLEGP